MARLDVLARDASELIGPTKKQMDEHVKIVNAFKKVGIAIDVDQSYIIDPEKGHHLPVAQCIRCKHIRQDRKTFPIFIPLKNFDGEYIYKDNGKKKTRTEFKDKLIFWCKRYDQYQDFPKQFRYCESYELL